MRPKRNKHPHAFGVFILVLVLSLAATTFFVYKNLPKPQQVLAKTPAPLPPPSPSPTPEPEENEINPVAAVLEGFKNVWSRSFSDFETIALKEENKIALTQARLALYLAYSDVMQPVQKLGDLTQTGTDLWTGESAEKAPMPAFISGSGVTYNFGINVPDASAQEGEKQESATQTSLRPTPKSKATASSIKPTPTPTLPMEAGRQLKGSIDRQENKLYYSAYLDGKLVCTVELAQSGAGYIGQIYRPKGVNKGVFRFCVQLSMVSCALFPDLDQETMGTLYEEANSWAVLSEGAQQCMTFSNGSAELSIGHAVQHFQ